MRTLTRLTCLVPFVLLCLQAKAIAATVTSELPREVRPVAYRIEVTPDAARLRFKGRLSLDTQVLTPTHTVTLQANNLRIRQAEWKDAVGHAHALTSTVDAAHESVTLHSKEILPLGNVTLEIAYEGTIGTQAAGFFALDYTTDSGANARALYTQFESHDARRFVPSFDEPGFRTPFTLDVLIPKGQTAVSNLPVESTRVERPGLVRWHFPATPAMSTYLLFLGVGDFERASVPVSPGRLEAGVVTRRGVISQGQFALEGSREVLNDYERWFDKPFPLPKLDNIAAPGQSQFFGAMENWGAIFTFEHALLVDPALATADDRLRIFEIAAHEIAHQWFGDLVTMAWWDDLWLNEGFASWMAGRATERLHPEWETAAFAVRSREGAMAIDALATTHPIVQHLTRARDVDEAFDSITYEKGNAVLRMLESYVGADVWQAGVRRYIARHAYGNTTSDDLWSAVSEVSTTPINDIAHAFVNNAGVPLVHVASTCEGGDTRLTLTPDEFRIGPNAHPKGHWPIPVTYGSVGGASARTVLDNGARDVRVAGCEGVIVNVGAGGYYRVDYDANSFAALVRQFNQLSVSDRLAITYDRLALARTGAAPAGDILTLVFLTPVDAPAPLWQGMIGVLESLDRLYADSDPGRAALRARIRTGLSPLMARLGWTPVTDESLQTASLRETVITALATAGDAGVLREAKRRHDGAAQDPTLVPGALRRVIDFIVALGADEATFESLRKRAAAERSPAMRAHLFTVLGSVEDKTLAMRALALALSDEPPKTLSPQIIRQVAEHYPDETLEFALAHLDAVKAKVDGPAWSRYVPSLVSMSVTPTMPARVRAFAAKELAGTEHRDADQAALSLEIRLEQRARLLPALDAWLAAHP
jgi:aminopeptidase N